MQTNPPDPALVALAQAASPALEGENPEPNQPYAGTAIAQSDTETVAPFIHTPRPPTSTSHGETPLVNFQANPCTPVYAYIIQGQPKICMKIFAGLSSADITTDTNADALESMARNLLDAAHYLRQQVAAQ